MAKSKSKFYAVAAGRAPGIYSTWAECERQVKGFSGAKFKSFKTREEASAFVCGGAAGSSGTQVARAPATSVAAGSGAAAARTSNPGANQPQKRPAPSARPSAPTAAKRPRATARADEEDGVVITVYFDGGARGNPGVAGAGAVVTRQISGDDIGRLVKIRQYCGPNATNNVAEYTGLLLGLRTAKEFAEKYVNDMGNATKRSDNKASAAISLTSTVRPSRPFNIQINVRGDSDLIVKQMNGQYQCKNAKLMPLFEDCRSIASQLKMMEHAAGDNMSMKFRVSIDISHVYRNDNKVADALANEAMDERRSWRTEFVLHADGEEEEVVVDLGRSESSKYHQGGMGEEEKKKGGEVIEIV